MRNKWVAIACAVVSAVCVAATASADNILRWNFGDPLDSSKKGLTVQAQNSLGVDGNTLTSATEGTFGGRLAMGVSASTAWTNFSIITGATYDSTDGSHSGGTEGANLLVGGGSSSGWSLSSFSASILFSAGQVSGGSLTFVVTDGTFTDTYTADFAAFSAADSIVDNTDGSFRIKAATENGAFTDGVFAGTAIAQWFAPPHNGSLNGSLLEFDFRPDSSGLDGDANIEMLVVVPAPPAVLWGLAGLAGVIGLRRSRMII